MRKILILLFVGFAIVSCNTAKQAGSKNLIKLSGKLEKIGMTTFQYGTHTLQVDAKTYALKSSKVDLNAYADKEVTLKGTKVDGYPVENGPELIEVVEITSK
jgi:hypothetical protein